MRRTKVTAEWEQLAISKVTSLDSHDARALSAPQPVPQPEPALESVPSCCPIGTVTEFSTCSACIIASS